MQGIGLVGVRMWLNMIGWCRDVVECDWSV